MLFVVVGVTAHYNGEVDKIETILVEADSIEHAEKQVKSIIGQHERVFVSPVDNLPVREKPKHVFKYNNLAEYDEE